MTDWYYHEPSQGRVGPLTAGQLRARYVERRIQLDTLVWHAGLREWQPLERLAEELQLDGVVPDPSQPPPLPPLPLPTQAAYTAPARPYVAQSRSSAFAAQPSLSAPSRRGMSGCAIVAIVIAVIAVPVLAILAAIAVPAYHDYTLRAKTSGVFAAASPMKLAIAQHLADHGACPDNDDFATVAQQFSAATAHATVQFGRLDNGHCAFELTLRGLGSKLDGKTWLHEAHRQNGELAWDCNGGDLPERYRPAACRSR